MAIGVDIVGKVENKAAQAVRTTANRAFATEGKEILDIKRTIPARSFFGKLRSLLGLGPEKEVRKLVSQIKLNKCHQTEYKNLLDSALEKEKEIHRDIDKLLGEIASKKRQIINLKDEISNLEKITIPNAENELNTALKNGPYRGGRINKHGISDFEYWTRDRGETSAEFAQRIEGLRERINELKTLKVQKKAGIREFESEIQSAESSVASSKQEIASVKNKQGEYNTRIRALDEENSDLYDKLSRKGYECNF